ncbi:MAG: alpha/beta hydrolase [Acidobacteria bacterium]|nr:alpha/beta hydrolase [Acidobacteriota bacterium]
MFASIQSHRASRHLIAMLTACLFVLGALPLAAQQADPVAEWASLAGIQYRVDPNIIYKVANGYEAKLDVYYPRNAAGPRPTVVYIHGGGWTGGTKESSIFNLLPYLEMGFNAVNVEYRLARNSLAPAAVEDCRCALRWVIRNAERYQIDTSKLVVTGHSAGGHLSLMTGILDPAAGLDNECPGNEELKVAAVVNFYGITDVADLLQGPHMQRYAVTWLGGMTDRQAIAKRASPLTYVRQGLPPILTVHGDADTTVPYVHAVRLHQALDGAGVTNELLTIPGAGHGGFNAEQTVKVQRTIAAFLKKHDLVPSR